MKKQTWIAAVLALTLIGSNPILCAAAEEAESVTAEVLEEAVESDADSENLELTEEELAENRYYYENDGEALRYLKPDGTWIVREDDDLVGAAEPDQLVHDERFASYIRHFGVDVSHYANLDRQAIDWNRVRASGRDFAIVKIGGRSYKNGSIYEDKWWKSNLDGALKAGLKVGVYFYSQALTEEEAIEEADFLINMTRNYHSRITLGYVMDYEYADNGTDLIGRLADAKLSKAAATNNVKAFCERVKASSLEPMLYGDTNYMTNSLNIAEIEDKYPIWMARYKRSGADYAGKYKIWQYGYSKVDGVPNPDCDADVWYEEPPLPLPDQLNDQNVQIMYRMYNPNSGEHFYTKNQKEAEMLVRAGWNYENIGWYAPSTSKAPVYRLYNPNAGDHHYTMYKGERDHLISVGWKDEGIGWYSADKESGVPLHRLYNPNAKKAGAHHYTTNRAECDMLMSVGWNDEEIGWYGVDYTEQEKNE